jgi:aspartate dehydrogenase
MNNLSLSSDRRGLTPATRRPIRIAIAGMGTVGTSLARTLALGNLPNFELVAVAVRDKSRGQMALDRAGAVAPMLDLHELPEIADLVVECAPAAILADICRPMLSVGKRVMVLSVGALLSHPDLIELADLHGGQIIVPTGALLGLDAVSAAREGQITSVRMVTRKPPKGLLGAPHLIKHKIEIDGITEPMKVFDGTAREAATGFPANLNVAVALALAGIGPDKTRLEIWADPTVTRNTHRIVVDSDSAHFDMTIENIPTENPKTGRITALSVIAALRKLTAPLRVGT